MLFQRRQPRLYCTDCRWLAWRPLPDGTMTEASCRLLAQTCLEARSDRGECKVEGLGWNAAERPSVTAAKAAARQAKREAAAGRMREEAAARARLRGEYEAREKIVAAKYPTQRERIVKAAEMRAAGALFRQIGEELNRSGTRVQQWLRRLNRSIPLRARARADMGRIAEPDPHPPRDVWLTYLPSPDPRLDNFVPCRPEPAP